MGGGGGGGGFLESNRLPLACELLSTNLRNISIVLLLALSETFPAKPCFCGDIAH